MMPAIASFDPNSMSHKGANSNKPKKNRRIVNLTTSNQCKCMDIIWEAHRENYALKKLHIGKNVKY